jgi:hypothetical protein
MIVMLLLIMAFCFRYFSAADSRSFQISDFPRRFVLPLLETRDSTAFRLDLAK